MKKYIIPYNGTIDPKSLRELISDSKQEAKELGKIILPLLKEQNLSRNEVTEISHVGKFALKIDSQIKIIGKADPPNPDFIIELQSKLIGLEHTQIQTDNAENYNRVITLFKVAEENFRIKYPKDKVHALISIKGDKLSYKLADKSIVADEIADLVYKTKNNLETKIPDYVSKIKTTIHSQVSFSYMEKNWRGPLLTLKRLTSAISKKEIKLNSYRKANPELSEFWLLLTIGSLSSASYELDEFSDYKMESQFDRVYLIDDFEGAIIRVK